MTIALGRGDSSTGGSGYIQKDGRILDVAIVHNGFEWQDNGLSGKLGLHIQPGDLTIDCEPILEAGVRILDPEGREAHLPRVMCRVKRNDGVEGVGWLDFNRVINREPSKTSA